MLSSPIDSTPAATSPLGGRQLVQRQRRELLLVAPRRPVIARDVCVNGQSRAAAAGSEVKMALLIDEWFRFLRRSRIDVP
jgi:hypothetical protein